MERRNFIKTAGALTVVPATGLALPLENYASSVASISGKKEIYEWRIYTLTGDGTQLDTFFEEALIPAYTRRHIKAGAFCPYRTAEGEKEKRYIVFIYPDIETYHKVRKRIWDDREFRQKAQAFFDASATAPAYSEFETYLCEAFDKIPAHRKPDPARTLLELRIYHSPNEEANQRKVKMFNSEEIDLFDKVAINSVLYGEILSGPNMPALLYLTWYRDEETRSQAWEQFRNHPDWKRMSALPEYAHTATRNQSIFLSPMPCSQI
jgi:hypothetical protein